MESNILKFAEILILAGNSFLLLESLVFNEGKNLKQLSGMGKSTRKTYQYLIGQILILDLLIIVTL